MRFLILGGGISGLAAAWFLRQKDPTAEIALLEKTASLGGCIATKRVDDYSFETGPRTFPFSRCPKLLSLIDALHLTQDLVCSDPASKARYLWVKGRLRTFFSLWPQLLIAAGHDLFAPKGAQVEESIYAFACRRFGKKAAELFFDPLAKGIFGGDIRKLSLSACFPTLQQMEQRSRSILLARKRLAVKSNGLFTLRGGMSRLIEALSLTPMDVHTECEVEAISQDSVAAGGRTWRFDYIISALPGGEIARLCHIDFPLRNASLQVVNLGYEEPFSRKGYGYLVPSSEKEELLGQIWDSAIFPEGAQTKVTSMVRSQRPVDVALEAMRRHLSETKEPKAVLCQEASIPQYEIGHKDAIEQLEAFLANSFPKLHLVGNYLIGPSVEACIARAQQVVSKIFSTY